MEYDSFPICKKSLYLAVYFETIVGNFSRYHKYTVGTELMNKSKETLGLLVKAINGKDRLEHLLLVRDKLEELKLLVRICKEIKAFRNFNSFEHSVKQVEEISRQNEGWMKKQKQR